MLRVSSFTQVADFNDQQDFTVEEHSLTLGYRHRFFEVSLGIFDQDLTREHISARPVFGLEVALGCHPQAIG